MFAAVEVKSETGRVSTEQAAFVAAVKAAGGLAEVARSVADAERIVFPGGAL